MKLAFSFLLTTLVFYTYSQKYIRDNQRERYPVIQLDSIESVKSVSIFVANQGYVFGVKYPKNKGLIKETYRFNEDNSISEVIKFNANQMLNYRYVFSYITESDYEVHKYNKKNKKKHSWIIKDSLLMQEIDYNRKGVPSGKWMFEYLKDSLIKQITKLNKEEQIEYQIINTFNGNDKLISHEQQKNNEVVALHEYQYDEKGNLIQTTIYSNDSTEGPSKQLHYQRDSSGALISRDYLKYNRRKNEIKLAYDSAGNIIEKKRFNRYGELKERYTYSYLIGDKLKSIKRFNAANKWMQIIENKYNTDDKIIRVERKENILAKPGGRISYERQNTYNSMGNRDQIKIHFVTSNSTRIVTYSYEYF